MKCPHCLVVVHVEPILRWTGEPQDSEGNWQSERYICPNSKCAKSFIDLACYETTVTGTYLQKRIHVYPKGTGRPPVPAEVPADFAEDYNEACAVLHDSPKASAALSRRCLQHILREVAGVKHATLFDEIDEVLESNQLPSYLAKVIDGVRNTGNFAAHPIKSKSTGEVVPVEPGEAEWNLDTLEGLFDFYFVQPAIMQTKRAVLDKKLQDAGKQPMKQPQEEEQAEE